MANAGFEEWAVARGGATQALASISGKITDTYGVGIPDVVVFLDANHNGVLDSNEVYTVTDKDGNYTFNNLAGGLGDFSKYDVQIVPPSGFTQVSPSEGPISLTQVDSHGIMMPTRKPVGRTFCPIGDSLQRPKGRSPGRFGPIYLRGLRVRGSSKAPPGP